MTNLAVIENKTSNLRKYLNILKGYKKYSQAELENDVSLKGAVERYLYLMAQSTIDLAEAMVAFKKFRKPTSMSESFHIFNEEGVIDQALTEKMVKMTGFRNIMANDYDKLNYDIVYDVLQNHLEDMEGFMKKI